MFIAILSPAVAFGRATERAADVYTAVDALAPAGTLAGVNLGSTEEALVKGLVRCVMPMPSRAGPFAYGGQCLRCPPDMTWNGHQCLADTAGSGRRSG